MSRVSLQAVSSHLRLVEAVKTITLDLFGTDIQVAWDGERWITHYLGAEGKKRPAPDIVVPADLPESEVAQYLSDLYHEWATDRHPNVKRTD